MEWIPLLLFVYIFGMLITFALKVTMNTVGPSMAYAIFWPVALAFYLLKYAIRGSIKYVEDFWK